MTRIRTLLVIATATAALRATSVLPAGAHGSKVEISANRAALTDLSPTTSDPTDGASAAVIAISREGKGTQV